MYCLSTELQASSSSEPGFKSITIRSVSGAIIARTGERQKQIVFVDMLPGIASSCCWCTAWVVEVMSGLCIPGNPEMNGPSDVSEAKAPIRWRPETVVVACRETGPYIVVPVNANSRFNAPKFSRSCGLFVWLSSPDNGRFQLVLVKPVGTHVGMQIGGSQDVRTRLWNLPVMGSDWSNGSRVWLPPNCVKSRVSRSFGDLGRTRSISGFGSGEPSRVRPRGMSPVFSPGAGPPASVH